MENKKEDFKNQNKNVFIGLEQFSWKYDICIYISIHTYI